jgi:hypothetical protein
MIAIPENMAASIANTGAKKITEKPRYAINIKSPKLKRIPKTAKSKHLQQFHLCPSIMNFLC